MSPDDAPVSLAKEYALATTAVLEGEREAARCAAEQYRRIERMRRAALALHFCDQSSGGPKWSPQVVIQRTVVTELAVAARLSEADARRRVDTAEGLAASYDGTRRLLEDGSISARHAEKIVLHGMGLPAEDIAAYESRLLPLAQNATAQRLEREARAAVEEAQPTTAIERHLSAAARRYLTLDPAADGMAYLTAFLPAVEAVAIHTRTTELARALKSGGDPRTLAQLRLDALCDLALNGETSIPGAPLGIRPRVRVTVPALTLLGHHEAGAAQLDGFGPIDRLTALELTRTAPSFSRILTDPVSGVALTYGRQRYTAPAALDDLVRTAWAECTFPLSCRSAASAELDHTDPFSEGGETSFANLSPLCSSHHKVKHHTEWRIEQHPGSGPHPGHLTWTSPAGFSYTVEPTRLARPLPRFTHADPATASRAARSPAAAVADTDAVADANANADVADAAAADADVAYAAAVANADADANVAYAYAAAAAAANVAYAAAAADANVAAVADADAVAKANAHAVANADAVAISDADAVANSGASRSEDSSPPPF